MNADIILSVDQIKMLIIALGAAVNSEGVFQVRLQVHDNGIDLIPHCQTISVKTKI